MKCWNGQEVQNENQCPMNTTQPITTPHYDKNGNYDPSVVYNSTNLSSTTPNYTTIGIIAVAIVVLVIVGLLVAILINVRKKK